MLLSKAWVSKVFAGGGLLRDVNYTGIQARLIHMGKR